MRYDLHDKPPSHQYLTSMYWAFQTLTTVGFGDISAFTTTEHVLALMWMIFGVGFYSFTIGNLSSIMASIDIKAHQLQTRLNTLSEFAKKNKLPEGTQFRIRRFIE